MSCFSRLIVLCFAIVLGICHGMADGSEASEFHVRATQIALTNCPLRVAIPSELKNAARLEVVDLRTQTRMHAQRIADVDECVFILSEPVQAGETARFELVSTEEPQPVRVGVLDRDGQLSMQLGDQEVLAYHCDIVEPPEGVDPLFRRSGHIHPVRSPRGAIVTDQFPADHFHQHALFAAWTKTHFEGQRVDFWNQKAGTGTVEHRDVLSASSGPVFGEFTVRLAHVVKGPPTQDVLEEVWTVRLYALSDQHLFEIESVQTCVAETPLTIDEYHYGGFAFRGAAEFFEPAGHRILTNETADREQANHSRPDWVAMSGTVNGETCGAVMFSHSSNFRSPQPVRVHPDKPYFVYSPCVLGEFHLEPGQPYRSRYAYLIFDGQPDRDRIEQIWAAANIKQPLTSVE